MAGSGVLVAGHPPFCLSRPPAPSSKLAPRSGVAGAEGDFNLFGKYCDTSSPPISEVENSEGLVAAGVADLAGQDSNTLTERFRPPLEKRERERRKETSSVMLCGILRY